jgi:hypothetical protein
MKKLIVVADWASDSLTTQEVRTTVEGFLQAPAHAEMSFVCTTTSTIHTSFLLAQLVEIEERYGRPLDTVFFQNTDPRLDTTNPVEKTKGAELLIIRLKSGIHLLGPNAGYDFSMIKDKIEVVYKYPGLDTGSQFRSRDLYSRVTAHLMDSLEDELELEETHSNLIPQLDEMYIGHIDPYGNIKTTIKETQLKGKYSYEDMITLDIHGQSMEAHYVTNLFAGDPDELVIYPGASGVKDDPFMEIAIWRQFKEGESSKVDPVLQHLRPGMQIMLP